MDPANLRNPGFVVWFTGLSGAGKSTLAQRLYLELKSRGHLVELLDGDEVRTHLSKGLGFSKEDRDVNVQRIGWVARVLARNGVIAITAAISPYRDTRNEVRLLAEGEGTPFIEVYADAPLEAVADRDVKGLYRRALAGELPHFTGVSDPYEAPDQADVTAHTGQEPVEESERRILSYLETRRLIATGAPCGNISKPVP